MFNAYFRSKKKKSKNQKSKQKKQLLVNCSYVPKIVYVVIK